MTSLRKPVFISHSQACRREKDLEETQRKLVGSTTDKKLLAELVESMQQHDEIIAGTRKPDRVTKVDAQSIKVLRASVELTRCYTSDNAYRFFPSKITNRVPPESR